MNYDIDKDPGFRRFCAQGERMFRERQQREPERRETAIGFRLPTSTREALAWLDAFHPERLKAFMADRSEAEKEAARIFLKEDRIEREKKRAASK